MDESASPVPTAGMDRQRSWRPAWSRTLLDLAAAAPALLLVPVLLTTVALLTPVPWGVPEPQRGPVLFAAFVGWVVLPFAVGEWLRRWWWPLLCLITVLVTVGLIADEGQIVIGGFQDYGSGAPYGAPPVTSEVWRPGFDGAPPVTVAVWQPGLALGALAALAAAAGVVFAPAIARLDRRVRHGLITAGLVAGIVPVVIAWMVGMGGACGSEFGTGLVERWAWAVLLVATWYGPYRAGLWIGQWEPPLAGGWVLACLLVPAALIWYWWPPYLEAVPDCSAPPPGYLGDVVLLSFGSLMTVIAAVGAAIGLVRAP